MFKVWQAGCFEEIGDPDIEFLSSLDIEAFDLYLDNRLSLVLLDRTV